MKWFRRNIKTGSRLALFALVVQFALSFGHFHSSAAQAAPAFQAGLTDGRAPCGWITQGVIRNRSVAIRRHLDRDNENLKETNTSHQWRKLAGTLRHGRGGACPRRRTA